MKHRGGDYYQFIQCLDTVASSAMASCQNSATQQSALANDDYEAQPWLCCGAMMEDFRRVTKDVGCELIDLFTPVRDPRFVLSEMSAGTKTVDLASAILANISCELCDGVCREAMTIKECAHRFCNECIQRWIRKGHTTCPTCPHVKLPSRRVLRPNTVLDEIVKKLLPNLESFTIPKLRPETSRGGRSRSSDDVDSDGDEDDVDMDESAVDESSSSEVVDEESDDEDDELESEEESEEDRIRQPRRASHHVHQQDFARAPIMPCMLPPPMPKSAYGQNLDELYADDMGYLEIFLVCLNSNLPPAVCSMARELSKRPMKLAVGATTRDAAMILAEKLVRDVLGPFDVHSIITDLSFVRDGDIWPAMSQIPLSEVCRQVTESRGPIALRYLLSDRLFSLCERIETSY